MPAPEIQPPDRIAIVGAGALGSLIAARLAASDVPVLLVSRPSLHLERIRRDGLQMIDLDDAEVRIQIPVADDTSDIASCGMVIIAVKTWATDTALQPLRRWLAPGSWIVTLQNGLDNDARLRAALGPAACLALGVTSLGAARLEPGIVRVGGPGATLFGMPGEAPPAALDALASRFSTAGMPAAVVADIELAIWRKLAVNAAINGLTALTAAPNGAIADDPDLRAAAIGVAREVEMVARAEGFELGDVERAVLDVATATAPNHSSMRQDLDAGNPTEVDAIYGAVVARAARHGLEVPAIRTLAAILRVRARAGAKERTE